MQLVINRLHIDTQSCTYGAHAQDMTGAPTSLPLEEEEKEEEEEEAEEEVEERVAVHNRVCCEVYVYTCRVVMQR